MSHQYQDGRVRFNAEFLQTALLWLIGKSLEPMAFRNDCTWSPVQVASAALLWAWSDEPTLRERFVTARKITAFLHVPQCDFGESYQCFVKLLRRWTSLLIAHLQHSLRAHLRGSLESLWEVHGFALFGVDGSRIELPRTQSHEECYSPRRRSRKRTGKRRHRPLASTHELKANTPQMWLTMLWHAGTGLPWGWRIGPADSSEREHWLEMIPELPENALVAADAGFVGYEYARALLDSGRHLLLRVGANVRLLRKLGTTKESGNTVYLWPRYAQPFERPLKLRLVVGHNGKHPIYLVTSVGSLHRLSDRQIIDIYRRRWGIEIFFRHLKQTYQRRKLRSANAANARVELEWSLLGLWGMALYAQVTIDRHGGDASRVSIACVLRSYRRMIRDYRHPTQRGETLDALLRCALRDPYTRVKKSSRHRLHKKRFDPPPRSPVITLASPIDILHAKVYYHVIEKG